MITLILNLITVPFYLLQLHFEKQRKDTALFLSRDTSQQTEDNQIIKQANNQCCVGVDPRSLSCRSPILQLFQYACCGLEIFMGTLSSK